MQVFGISRAFFAASLVCGSLFVFSGAGFAAPPTESDSRSQSVLPIGTKASIDYTGFMDLAETVEPFRANRLISLAQFNTMASEEGTLILDTRSAADFAAGHIKGAVNLNFSEFTVSKLAAVIGDKERRILIYCNNNFTDNFPPVLTKIAPLALNVPTFINLYGYGYENVYELGETMSVQNPDLEWVGEPISFSRLSLE